MTSGSAKNATDYDIVLLDRLMENHEEIIELGVDWCGSYISLADVSDGILREVPVQA